jgi:hypothetical protein
VPNAEPTIDESDPMAIMRAAMGGDEPVKVTCLDEWKRRAR